MKAGGGLHGHRSGATRPEDEPQRIGSQLDGQIGVRLPRNTADLDARPRPHSVVRSPAPINSARASPGSGAVMKRSPMRNALQRRAPRRRMSSAVFSPLSATAAIPAGM